MSIHKLTAGSGYTYLTRQVATQDATERGHSSLASYYTEKGETPGRWVGSGLAGLDGISAGDVVTEAHMLNLFGSGHHPLAEQLRAEAAQAGADVRGQERAARLGVPFPVYPGDVSSFRVRVAERVAELTTARGLPAGSPASIEDRAQARTEVATALFREKFGRDPADARELAATIAKASRPRTNAVAGYDLSFSPVKSVSTLWAVADLPVAAAIEKAHHAAVEDALAFLERSALFTREGTGGVRQVETRGLVSVAFTHRDSRAGDPDLHTHVAVANKVQTRDGGKWLAIDGRPLFKAATAASEVYNTALEAHLRQSLGVRFVDVAHRDPRKRPTREIVGVDPALASRWSTRRAHITSRTSELARTFQADHGRPPTPVEAIKLAQQATLETREAKHPARSLAEQRESWAEQAREVLGSDHATRAMVAAALSPTPTAGPRIDTAWIQATAARIGRTLAEHRSVWQQVHVYAEAQRQVRHTHLTGDNLQRVVALLVDEVLTTHSVVLARPGHDPQPVPPGLRRSDGASVYTQAGTTLFTSPQILAAEARLVSRAGQYDGARAPDTAVQTALTTAANEGVPLNAGQVSLVREMATSGARVQLAIAPAGAGKTTAMRALTHAWTSAGGQVLGLAPSAAAAHVLGESIDAATDTLAKLAWHLQHPALGELPTWMTQIGPDTLVLVDEAGMADTLTLDQVIEHVITQGASVRLIGDDQQLAALGAGGVLRDIRATHGSLHLSELMRFTDPAEGAASLALRDGAPEALGFYLDHHRVHVGDLATLTNDLFTAWATDRTRGVDAIMLAPTRDLVADLNQRARTHRLTTAGLAPAAAAATATVTLADGATASVGDVVITRANDRRLPLGATDFVKNGDRWTLTALLEDGAVTARHLTHHRTVTLPAAYVAAHVELGYASTIHTAQGVTAAASHTLLTGAESRQLLYTAATRGRAGNHLYLQLVGDADEHALIRPETLHPRTATDILEGILARDDSARSATSTARETDHPAPKLTDSVARYTDSLYLAAEEHLGTATTQRIEQVAEKILPGMTDAPAWSTLRAHLLLLAAHDIDPVQALTSAARHRGFTDAHDPAAVLDWRLTDIRITSAIRGPLPWLPGVPQSLADDPTWGPALSARAATVRADTAILTGHLSDTADQTPAWARLGHARPAAALLAQVEVWRAATGIDSQDRRPTGPARPTGTLAGRYQQHLTRRLASGDTPAMQEWAPTLTRILPRHDTDAFTPVLAERLAALSRAGLHTPTLLREALSTGALPDDHAAAALWWRLAARLSPAVAATTTGDVPLSSSWAQTLPDLVGADTAAQLRASSWWATLVTVIDHALARGHTLENLLTHLPDDGADVDPCQALIWRISITTNPTHLYEGSDDGDPGAQPPEDLDLEPVSWAPTAADLAALPPLDDPLVPENDVTSVPPGCDDHDVRSEPADVEAAIAFAELQRDLAGPLPLSDQQIETQVARAIEADTSPVTPERIAALNDLATDYYQRAFVGSWAQTYLTERLAGTDLTGDPHVCPGHAPAGWTALIDHLGGHGATDEELLAAGLATTTREGRLIDRFRDRLILPITHPAAGLTQGAGKAVVLGFVARRHPHHTDTTGGPKYLNTPDTVLFHKGAQLYTADSATTTLADATPVLVEGPLDALAITTAGNGRYLGVAPLGTALTEDQARQLAVHAHLSGTTPIVATDTDTPGRTAATRAYWLLTQHGLSPTAPTLPAGTDPAQILAHDGAHVLRNALRDSAPLSNTVLAKRLAQPDRSDAMRDAVAALAAASPDTWGTGSTQIAQATDTPLPAVRRHLARALEQRSLDIRTATETGLRHAHQTPKADTKPTAPSTSGGTADQHQRRHLPAPTVVDGGRPR